MSRFLIGDRVQVDVFDHDYLYNGCVGDVESVSENYSEPLYIVMLDVGALIPAEERYLCEPGTRGGTYSCRVEWRRPGGR